MIQSISWSPGVTLDDVEKMVILKAYSFYRQNKTVTAQALKISIRTLDSKLARYDMDGKEAEKRHADTRNKREEFLARSRGRYVAPQADIQAQNDGYLSSQRMGVQSAPENPSQREMPMPQRAEVQNVLPKTASKNHPSKSGKTIPGSDVET